MRNVAIFCAIPVTLATVAVLTAASAGGNPTARTIRLYEHDTSQANIDLGEPGDGVGDQFVFAGDTFSHKGGKKLGRLAGTFTTASPGDSGELVVAATFALPDGQISTQGLFVASDLFGGKTASFAITGGTGRYRHARGVGTVQLPQDVPNLTDARFVLRLR
jgi:hypothetical protein